tara:strand:- start:209 stop:1123 length:915 start_codon:yes stop_codon:yes gene_type:complete
MGMGINTFGPSKEEKELNEKAEIEARLQAGTDRFNQMMANRSQNPVLRQTQAGMSGFDQFQAIQAARGVATDSYNNSKLDGFNSGGAIGGLANQLNDEGKLFTNTAVNQQPGYDQFQAMQAARDSAGSTYGQNPGMEAISNIMASKGDPNSIYLSNITENYRNRNSGPQPGYDRFQSMQAARDSANYNVDGSSLPPGVVSWADLENGSLENKIRAYNTGQRSEQAARFNASMGANPLILQQLQMGQRQMGPQFNAFGFGAQPGLAAQGGQGGQGGSMLANMSSQGMNQLAAGQQNNPTIFKAKS